MELLLLMVSKNSRWEGEEGGRELRGELRRKQGLGRAYKHRTCNQ